MNDFVRQWSDIRKDALKVVDDIGQSGWYILGGGVRGFETALASYWGHSSAIGVASGLDAIEISLRAVGMQPGDRVLTTPMSAFATTLAIVKSGGIPVFCDTDEYGLIDLNEVRSALRAFPDTRFFVPVHLYGMPLDRLGLQALINEFQLVCIEDCAQSIGAKSHGQFTGLTGIAAATSFYPTKNLGAMGDGGAVLTSNDTVASRLRSLRDYGQTAKYRHTEIGWNSRLDELQAALLERVLLPRLENWTQRRRQIARHYLDHWPSSVVLPLGRIADDENDWAPAWHLFPVRVSASEKPEFMRWLRANGIQCGEHYPILIPDQEAMLSVNSVCFGTLERAKKLAVEEVTLPIHPYMSTDDVDAVLEAVGSWRP